MKGTVYTSSIYSLSKLKDLSDTTSILYHPFIRQLGLRASLCKSCAGPSREIVGILVLECEYDFQKYNTYVFQRRTFRPKSHQPAVILNFLTTLNLTSNFETDIKF